MADEPRETEEDKSEEVPPPPSWMRVGCFVGFMSLAAFIGYFIFPWIGWRRKRRTKKEDSQSKG